MTPAKATRLLRECIEHGSIIPTNHAIERMVERHISREELFQVLQSGHISRPAEQELKTGEWKYRVEGHTLGRAVAAVFKFVQIGRAVVITVFEVK